MGQHCVSLEWLSCFHKFFLSTIYVFICLRVYLYTSLHAKIATWIPAPPVLKKLHTC